MVCDFQATDENILRLGDREFALRTHYGIDTSAFMALFHKLVDNYSFRISKAVFKVDVPYENHKKKGLISAIREYIDFEAGSLSGLVPRLGRSCFRDKS